MITAQTVDTFLAIGACSPFDRLTEIELLVVAQHIHRRDYEPGELILTEGVAADKLVIVLAGSVLAGDRPAPHVFDAASVLFSLPVAENHLAGREGAETLWLAKPHLFTLARECPDFVVGLATLRKDDWA